MYKLDDFFLDNHYRAIIIILDVGMPIYYSLMQDYLVWIRDYAYTYHSPDVHLVIVCINIILCHHIMLYCTCIQSYEF